MKKLIPVIFTLSKKKIYKIYRGSVYWLDTSKKYCFGLTARTAASTVLTIHAHTRNTRLFTPDFYKTRHNLKV